MSLWILFTLTTVRTGWLANEMHVGHNVGVSSTPLDRMAVTVIGGYLGSGKTTLVNHILATADERVAVLVNDFGDINIDAALIKSRGDNTVELSNGCICCSMVDGFSAALDQIVAIDPRPDRLVIEASGVSDPATVAAYGHGPGMVMDAVVVLADAETVRAKIDDKYVGQTIRGQLDAAHVVVINKADLVSPESLDEVVAWAGERCPEAVVVTAAHAQVAPEILFGHDVAPLVAHEHAGHVHHEAADVFQTSTFEQVEPMTRDDVEKLMSELPDMVVRAKGFVLLDDAPEKPALLQRVGQRWTLRARLGEWQDTPATRIVIIETAQE